jgi:hypothetical protein
MGISIHGKISEVPADDVGSTTTGAVIEIDEKGLHSHSDPKKLERLRKWDPFLDVQEPRIIDDDLSTEDVEKEAAVEDIKPVEDSPYPEVRAAVSCCRPVRPSPCYEF